MSTPAPGRNPTRGLRSGFPGAALGHIVSVSTILDSGRKTGEAAQVRACFLFLEGTMVLRLIGGDPDSPQNGSPTIWLDDADDSVVIQGWRITDEATMSAITAKGPIP